MLKYIIILFMFISIIYLYNNKINENFTSYDQNVINAVNKMYNTDFTAMRNLNDIVKQIQLNGDVTLDKNIITPGTINISKNNKSFIISDSGKLSFNNTFTINPDGFINITNPSGATPKVGFTIYGNTTDFNTLFSTYDANIRDLNMRIYNMANGLSAVNKILFTNGSYIQGQNNINYGIQFCSSTGC